MRAMVFDKAHHPLRHADLPVPTPDAGQLLVHVHTCGVCRTDLHLLDGELPAPKPHVVPGHEIIGTVRQLGKDVSNFSPGQRVGIPWLAFSCGKCGYCLAGQENLCRDAKFNGYTLDGGYAEYVVADARYCFAIPERYGDQEAAPLLCAGLIGYRALKMAGDATRRRRIGIYGFGAAAHIVAQIIAAQGRQCYAFTRPGDVESQDFARSLGAVWAGGSNDLPSLELDAALIFAPVGGLVPTALRAIAPGGCVVCAGIHMSDIPAFPYALLWGERQIVSVANLTRADGLEFFELAGRIPLKTATTGYELTQANEALEDLRQGRIHGAAVLHVSV